MQLHGLKHGLQDQTCKDQLTGEWPPKHKRCHSFTHLLRKTGLLPSMQSTKDVLKMPAQTMFGVALLRYQLARSLAHLLHGNTPCTRV